MNIESLYSDVRVRGGLSARIYLESLTRHPALDAADAAMTTECDTVPVVPVTTPVEGRPALRVECVLVASGHAVMVGGGL